VEVFFQDKNIIFCGLPSTVLGQVERDGAENRKKNGGRLDFHLQE